MLAERIERLKEQQDNVRKETILLKELTETSEIIIDYLDRISDLDESDRFLVMIAEELKLDVTVNQKNANIPIKDNATSARVAYKPYGDLATDIKEGGTVVYLAGAQTRYIYQALAEMVIDAGLAKSWRRELNPLRLIFQGLKPEFGDVFETIKWEDWKPSDKIVKDFFNAFKFVGDIPSDESKTEIPEGFKSEKHPETFIDISRVTGEHLEDLLRKLDELNLKSSYWFHRDTGHLEVVNSKNFAKIKDVCESFIEIAALYF